MKKSDPSRDLPSELRCQNKTGLKACSVAPLLRLQEPDERRPGAPRLKRRSVGRRDVKGDGRAFRGAPPASRRGRSLAPPNLNVWPASWTSRGKNDRETSEGRVFRLFFLPPAGEKKKEAPAVKVIKPFRVGSNNSKNKRSQKLSSEAPVFSHERVNLLKQNQVRAAPCFFSDRHTSEAREHGWFPSLQIS